MSVSDASEIVTQFEKATFKLHCMLCGDTMLAMDIGIYACIECNTRQEIMTYLGVNSYVSAEDGGLESFEGEKIVPKEFHIKIEKVPEGVNLLKEFVKTFEEFC